VKQQFLNDKSFGEATKLKRKKRAAIDYKGDRRWNLLLRIKLCNRMGHYFTFSAS
jgi:hypothetical protein